MLKIILPMISLLILPKFSKMFFHQNWIMLFILFFLSLFLIPLNFSFSPSMNMFSMDLMSASLLSLSLWISILMIIASYKVLQQKNNEKLFSLTILALCMILILTFSTNNLMMFYIMFESSLIPTLFIIIGWGYQPERLQAGTYLMIYTITASLPLLFSLLLIYNQNSHLSIIIPQMSFFIHPTSSLYSLWWLFSLSAFLVKMPLYLVHLWLPKAHVEAPVAGSMILAGILLKLGSYGFIRLATPFQSLTSSLAPMISSIALCGAFITGFICIRQHDLKSLIAYSSVGHMGLLTAGMMSCSQWGWYGSLSMMIAHGLCSSCMFALANMYYEVTNTRSLFLTKGMMTFFPALTFWFFMASAGNMAAPPSMNLLSEIILLSSILSMFTSSWLMIGFASFLAAAYSLFLYTSTQHGSEPNFLNPMSLFISRNYSICLLHLTPLFILPLKTEIFSLWI